jgi:GntR family transcriptional regulator
MTTYPVSRTGSEPLHAQLKRALLADVKARGLRPGDRLPSEPEIGDTYRVSRATVRQAISALVSEGVLQPIQGKGTFIADPATTVPQLSSRGALTSFTRNLLAQGHVPSVRTLVSHRRPPPMAGISDPADAYGGACRYLLRTLLADGRPIGLQETWIPLAVIHGADDVLEADVLAGGSLYEALRAAPLNLALHSGVETVGVARADALCAELIECQVDDPVLLGQRYAHLPDTTVAEYSRMRFREDRYEYRIEMGELQPPNG